MGHEIDVQKVSQVLLADGWHRVSDMSFMLDSHEYIHHGNSRVPNEFDLIHRAGDSHVCPTGFSFAEEYPEGDERLGQYVGGPLTAILAVRYQP